MLSYRLIGGCLSAGLVAVALFAAGHFVARPAAAKPPVARWHVSDEQQTIAVASLIDWLERNDIDALSYEFPSPLGCRRVPSRKLGGITCQYGITYPDETTRRYWVLLNRHNLPYGIGYSKRVARVAPPA